jgi:hypothetical protein
VRILTVLLRLATGIPAKAIDSLCPEAIDSL